MKSPLDLWIYQELINEVKPDIIFETGTHMGGSALFLASMCDLVGNGQVISIDLNEIQEFYPEHPRLTYWGGKSSVDRLLPIEECALHADSVMVILDSDHSEAHVRAEIERFAPLVTVDSYLIVEDTAVNGHPILPSHGPGPMEAVNDFLSTTDEFAIDIRQEKFLMTFNPRGYLKRVKPAQPLT